MADTVFVPDDGITKGLQLCIASGGIWDTSKVRLFTNNITPSDASIISDFVEATNVNFPSYAAVALAFGSWSAVTVTTHTASSTYPNITWTRSSTGTSLNVYGWYITDSGNTKLYAAARFSAAPLTVTNAGDNIVLSGITSLMKSIN